MKRLLILILLVGLILPTEAIAQNSIGFKLGIGSYEGDLHCFDQDDLNLWNSAGLSFGVYGRKSFGNFLNGRLAYQYARFKGDDKAFDQQSGHPNRNFSFVNNMHELTLKVDIEPFRKWKVSPFASIGAGLGFNSPNTLFDLRNKSDDQIAQISEDQTNLPRVILAVPVGLGFNVKLTERLAIGTEFAMRMPVSDYLDGVSSSAMSEYNDYFGTGTVNLNYTFVKTKSTSTRKITNKDQNLAEQMINVHPPSDDSGEITPPKASSQKTKSTSSEKFVEESIVEEIRGIESKEETNITSELDAEASIEEKKTIPALLPDSDGDGLIDKLDECPLLFAKTINGCPEKIDNGYLNCEGDFLQTTIQFQTSVSELYKVDQAKLKDAAVILLACPDLNVVVEGHTDSEGSELVNQSLSEKRAGEVMSYLVNKGIDAQRIRVFGFGGNQPIADNKTEEGRSLNRRVVISFSN